jgi:flavin-dependent dehydrogenase
MTDVIVVGAGPAGTVAASVLARAGARVVLIDRARFPRPKLCGDTLNPGTLALLRRLQLATPIEAVGLGIDGMLVTGAGGVRVVGRYPTGVRGRSLTRFDLDGGLVDQCTAAGVDFLDGTRVQAASVDGRATPRVVGVRLDGSHAGREIRAAVTIAADGRCSTVASGLGLTRHPVRPRRWAIGAYATGVSGMTTLGEMHIRPGCYIGVAPLPDGVTNVCLVKPSAPRDRAMRAPATALREALMADPDLWERFASAALVGPPAVLGPLAVDVVQPRLIPNGLILAGDAAGFIDPMTGDGLRFAVEGGELAARAALEALTHGWSDVQTRLAAARARAFGAKWRLNRTLRALVGVPMAVRLATLGARVAPGVIRALIVRASDCDLIQAPAECAALADFHCQPHTPPKARRSTG